MSRRSLLVALSFLAVLLGGVGLLLYLVVGYEPEVYSQARPPDGEERVRESGLFLTELNQLRENAKGPADPDWYVRFQDAQVNSYLEEGFVKEGFASRLLPEGVSRPHFVFEPNRIHVAFRYGRGGWNTVISIDLRVWLAKEEMNAVALELEGLRAGALPINGQWLLEEFAKVGRDSGSDLEVTWYRLNGHPVALLRFQAEQAHPTLLLQDVHLDKGSLTIRGKSPEAALHSMLLNFPDGLAKLITD